MRTCYWLLFVTTHSPKICSYFLCSFLPLLKQLLSVFFFCRSNGARGADVETLRGTSGADFEGIGTIERVSDDAYMCGCCFVFNGKSDANIQHLLLIKGPFIFVYSIRNQTSPKYAISLESLSPKIKDNNDDHDKNTILLQTSLSETRYEIHFQNNDDAIKLNRVVREQSAVGRNNTARTKLGHGHLIDKRTSVKYAEEIALKKYIQEEPEEPINTKDILDTMGTTQMGTRQGL